jgi:hypothetical protein
MGNDASIYACKNKDHVNLRELRNHRELCGYMSQLYNKQNPDTWNDPEDPFNGGITFIDKENCDEIIEHIGNGDFDNDHWDVPSFRERDMGFFRLCKVLIDAGYRIHYTCSY